MATDLGFSGQESDVNRACSAFGLDTVNYRAFPNNGPVPAAEPEPDAMAPRAEPPAPAFVPATPAVAAATLPPAPQPWPAAPDPQPAPAPVPQLAPAPGPQWAPAPSQNWAPAPSQNCAPAPSQNWAPAPGPPAAAPYPSGQPQSNPGMPGGFSLLQQALPSGHHHPARMPAFAMARSPLQPLPPSGGAPLGRPAAATAANPESFGIAFGTAFNAAFGNPDAGAQGPAGYPRPQT